MPSTKQVFDYCYQLEDEACLLPIYTRDHAPDQDVGDIYLESRGLERWKSPLCADKIHPLHNHPTDVVRYVHTRHLVTASAWLIPPERIRKGTFSTDINVDTCEGLLYFLVFLEVVAITLSEVIFGLRAYAMWNRNRAILVIYGCVATAYIVALAFILQSFLPSITFRESPLALISGCYKTGGSSIVFAAFVIYMLTEAVTTALTLYRAFRHFRHTPNVLVQNMTRDGVFYCMSMFSMSVANVLLIFLVPIQYADMIAVYQTVMHTMLATRMQLHLRKVDHHAYLMNLFAAESLAPMSFTRPTFLADI
ncbi:hypothetical protein PAXINDRAFT_18238 [Paxillus involutus ATCC 200175]|uniref:Uncharacterized protein n=1 Tax=Paxillus involutus ATCC 200175 TaxID=664439 RepID=A0A0C9TLM5_PAXIN|nr:hypothetical protein PAXINDRAFT_18238 [Paxillus involutus ATCC 200175]